MERHRRTIALLAAMMCGLVPPAVTAGPVSAAPVVATDGLREGQAYRSFIVTPEPGAALSVAGTRTLATGGEVVRAGRPLDAAGARAFMAELAASPGVASVEPDLPVARTSTPDDPRYGEQWPLWQVYGQTDSALRVDEAWDTGADGGGVTVAVLDTGIRPHADLTPNLVAGYDFIADPANTADGDGRDGDARDPGDWNDEGDCGATAFSPSSWHGTHIAGIVAAVRDNGIGVTGVAPAARVQPVRVLGTCGGLDSDIADAIVWAAGDPVPGAPVNPTPARVINMSLGGYGPCGPTLQAAVDKALSRGASVVVSAGNAAADAADYHPANCAGVVTVGATGDDGYLASYSNHGDTVEVAAPGGWGYWRDNDPAHRVLSTVDAGAREPSGDAYGVMRGTSQAAAYVSGAVALLLSRRPDLTPAQVSDYLMRDARRLPLGGGWYNSAYPIGGGLIDVARTIHDATGTPGGECTVCTGSAVIVDVAVPTGTPAPVHLAGTLSALGTGRPDWDPASVRAMRWMRTSWDGTGTPAWRIQLAGTPGATIDYKLTLGGWPTVERARDCAETPNRTVTLPGDGTLWAYATVDNWNGTGLCSGA
ncbi:S8 family serine peptidase [Actinoplanes xinjiangensis]|uniref:alpha-amylase n=1 Tax=Actinoplanes xinjiangensis TaxID=512350 RepID=A0A316FIX4_9ACTN|nr:S8 family serine peptidase [Actinoplanes xinjiangensis]PWK48075.1 subtilase family protein [Actinoplanes xinjiangensis]GIF39174.1 extracellular protease [Actinoplanes xinjiangensis]